MCLAVPVQIRQLLDDSQALVHLGGIEKVISIALLEQAVPGDYVIVHAGYALTKLNEEEAQKTLDLFANMMDLAK